MSSPLCQVGDLRASRSGGQAEDRSEGWGGGGSGTWAKQRLPVVQEGQGWGQEIENGLGGSRAEVWHFQLCQPWVPTVLSAVAVGGSQLLV